jgi:hypothetical protein
MARKSFFLNFTPRKSSRRLLNKNSAQ